MINKKYYFLFLIIIFLIIFVLICNNDIKILSSFKNNYPINYVYINRTRESFLSISDAIKASKPGDVIYIKNGVYNEHLIINKSLSLIGIGSPVINGEGFGTIITIVNTNNVLIKGIKIINSGVYYSSEDSGIKIINSSNIKIINNELKDVFFGILPKDSKNIWIINNTIISIPEYSVTERQHGVYAWYSYNLYVINNTFKFVKDGVYNDHVYNALIKGNHIEYARYGVHLMYCENFTIEGNYVTESIAGQALMYSKNIRTSDNVIILNKVGGIGEGIFVPETDDVIIEGNYVIGNVVGLNIRKVPYSPGSVAIIRNNVIAFNYIGVSIDADSAVSIYNNSFIENIRDVSLIGFSMGGNKWFNESIKIGNFWSEYRGSDKNGDNIGDEPFVSQDILEDIMDGYSQLRILMYSPAYFILEVMKKSFLINPRIKAVDLYPLIRSPHHVYMKSNLQETSLLLSLTLTIVPLFLIFYFRRGVMK